LKRVSAYIPAYNNEDTIVDAITSLKKQIYPINEIFVIDDGSSDKTIDNASRCGVDVYTNQVNKGRGFTRSRAMKIAKNNIVVCCDATNELDLNFVDEGIKAFNSNKVSSVFGKICSKTRTGTVNKWRSIHLFKENAKYGSGFQKSDLFITYGAIVRKSHIMAVGNFNAELKHSEDEEMGKRLLANGYTLLSNHDLNVYCNFDNSLREVFERYWRWNVGKDQKMSLRDYAHSIKSSIKPMVQEDLQTRHWSCIPISLICPHYCYFKTLITRGKNKRK
jgi:biofilm PGA synthesis N-glycosyltransferase PgaC